jgi:hypothetical protein
MGGAASSATNVTAAAAAPAAAAAQTEAATSTGGGLKGLKKIFGRDNFSVRFLLLLYHWHYKYLNV